MYIINYIDQGLTLKPCLATVIGSFPTKFDG